MKDHSIFIEKSPTELAAGLKVIQELYPHRFSRGKKARKIEFVRSSGLNEPGLIVKKGDGVTTVHYARMTDAFRALGRLMGERTDAEVQSDFSEQSKFETLGVMLDVSRNGVIRPDAVKDLLRRFALMGLNMAILYAEDTYEIPGEPFFGYQRGRYTQKETRELDAYAAALGIEMFPCIQTLAHLEQILQWPAYAEMRDVAGVLLAEDPKVYAFIEKMITAASAPFRSRRIHIGMDEAQGIGTGNYLKRFGLKRPFDILNGHLSRVNEICSRRGLRPMIWSDMYFRLGSETGDYYDVKCKVPKEVASAIPRDMQVVYWDYYHLDTGFYEDWIGRHRAMNCEPIMAGGIWTWNHFWAALPFSITTTDACMQACKKTGLREAFTTLWGDDGMECDVFSALPGIQYFAEHGYHDSVDADLFRSNFYGSCEASLEAWLKASEIDSMPALKHPERSFNNCSKWQLWDDPLIGLAQPQRPRKSLKAHYRQLSVSLDRMSTQAKEDKRLTFPAQIARVLALKYDLRDRLVAAYRRGEYAKLRAMRKTDIRLLLKELRKLWKLHRQLWLDSYRPFGLEVLEQRYGGLIARFESLAERIDSLRAGVPHQIPEFETKLLPFARNDAHDIAYLSYGRIATSSCVR